MKVIRASVKHLSQLAVLFDAYRVFYEQESDLKGSEKFLRERMEQEQSVIFAVEENNRLLGFTQLYPLFSSTRMRRTWLLNDLFVAQNQRGKGISKLLMEAAKEHARKTGAFGLSLETQKSNTVGNNLYPAVNFTLDEEHNYYFWTVENG